MSALSQAPELLMPAGSPEKMRIAFAYGADAVYCGVPIFSLRARGNGFNKDNIGPAIEEAHRQGKKVYLTMNIYAHNSKVDRFLDSFCEMQDLNPDGFIMTDIGLISKAMKLRSEATFHLSTQANATNWAAVEFWRDLGVKRVILSRELKLKEIITIHEKVPDVELEAFVHGAICIAYSGRCLISNYMNHRDANQGTCTNSCRWDYQLSHEKGSLLEVESQQIVQNEEYQKIEGTYYVSDKSRGDERFELDEDEHGTYMMNSKDLCAIELLQELRDAGICSFKVEGRTKSMFYAAVVSRAYRRAIDDMHAGRPFNPDHLREVMTTANRTLMTGFLTRKPQEYGENFDDGGSLPLTHQFAGTIKHFNPANHMTEIEVKNRISVGDTIEWITPTETISETVEALFDTKGESFDVRNPGQSTVLKAPLEANDLTFIRKKMENRLPIYDGPAPSESIANAS